jgi:transcriptional regulator with GAF, ATPase, and Fis domain
MVAVNLGGIPDGLFESELFGHVRGAFTDAKTDRVGRFELADGGTLFLDEIANLPHPQQAKLLRVLETGEYERVGASRARRADVRVVAATNAELEADVAAGRFRRDLYYRLNVFPIRLPPLRERAEDIAALADHFLRHACRRARRAVPAVGPEASSYFGPTRGRATCVSWRTSSSARWRSPTTAARSDRLISPSASRRATALPRRYGR